MSYRYPANLIQNSNTLTLKIVQIDNNRFNVNQLWICGLKHGIITASLYIYRS